MLGCVGKSVPRLDGFDKVTGRTKYLDDIEIPDCWYGAVVRSPIPNGRIKNVEFDAGFDWTSVFVCTAKDIPGKNTTIFITEEQPILADEYVRHVGEAIVLVAAPTKELAKKAASLVRVEIEELPSVLTIEDAKASGNIVWGKDNIQAHFDINKGDISAGFKEADFVVEAEYRTGFHEHLYIEPQGMAAIPRADGGLTVTGSCQCPFYVLKTLKAVLACQETEVNVVQTPMGGAFGGKEDYPSLLGTYVALLCKKSGRPVKMVYARDEDIEVTTKRHPSIVKHKTGVKRDGSITAMEIDIEFDGGAYTTLSQVVLSRGLIHAAGPYRCDNIVARAVCYATNKVPTGAYRGFGAPQTIFALESHLDKVAEKVGMDPFTFRLKNCVHIGDTLSTTQLLRESVAVEECLRSAGQAARFVSKWHKNIEERNVDGQKIKKGIGLSLYMHGGAFTGSGESVMKTEAGLRLEPDGRVTVLTGCTDMGQGATTVLPQIAADAVGIPIELVGIAVPDTAVVPDSGPTVASRTTMIIGSVLQKCGEKLKNELLKYSGGKEAFEKVDDFKIAAEKYLAKKGGLKIVERYELPSGIKWDAAKHLGDAYPAYSWAADVAEVSVDSETFEVTVDKMTVAVDVGKAVNPVLVEGQIEGGTLQALGWGLMEDSPLVNGKPVANRLQTYIIPTVADTPDWHTIIIEEPFSGGPHGVKGVGELPLDGGAPAIANAIYNATGLRIDELPITAEKLYRCHSREGGNPVLGVTGSPLSRG